MARKKSYKPPVFRGRAAKLNRALLKLAHASGSDFSKWDMKQRLPPTRDFKHTHYSTVNKRVEALEKSGYLQEAGIVPSKNGSTKKLYKVTEKAKFALNLDVNDFDEVFYKLDEPAFKTLNSTMKTK